MYLMDSEFGKPNGNGAWYAVQTGHQHEKAVAGILANKGFETFLPLYSAVHRWKDRNKVVSLPLFPCYVFLRGEVDRKIQILTTPGVYRIVGTAGRPGAIPESEISSIRQAVQNTTKIQPHPFLTYGDRVRITSGPLFGLEGILVGRPNRARLVLSIEMLARSVSVEVDIWRVERITPHKPDTVPPLFCSPIPMSLPPQISHLS